MEETAQDIQKCFLQTSPYKFIFKLPLYAIHQISKILFKSLDPNVEAPAENLNLDVTIWNENILHSFSFILYNLPISDGIPYRYLPFWTLELIIPKGSESFGMSQFFRKTSE